MGAKCEIWQKSLTVWRHMWVWCLMVYTHTLYYVMPKTWKGKVLMKSLQWSLAHISAVLLTDFCYIQTHTYLSFKRHCKQQIPHVRCHHCCSRFGDTRCYQKPQVCWPVDMDMDMVKIRILREIKSVIYMWRYFPTLWIYWFKRVICLTAYRTVIQYQAHILICLVLTY